MISTLYLFDQILVQKLFLDCLEEQSNSPLFTDRTDECNLLEACKHRARSVNTFIFSFLFTQSFLYQIKKFKILFHTLWITPVNDGTSLGFRAAIIFIKNNFLKHKQANINVKSRRFIMTPFSRQKNHKKTNQNQIFALFIHFALRMVSWWYRDVGF